MRAASILIKPASSVCNIKCEYCFYRCISSERQAYSKGFMRESTLEQLVRNAFEYVSGHITFAFQGGEPTLCGLDFFSKAIELQKRYNENDISVENTIQTNGLTINDAWCEFLCENDILVGLSLDGYQDLHDRYRIDRSGQPTFGRVMETVKLFEKYGVKYNILSVITDPACGHAKELYSFYTENHFPFVQLIPCIGEENSSYGIKPERYGTFLCEFFDCWYRDFERGYSLDHGVRFPVTDVRFFSNLAQIAAGYPAEECGLCGHCSCYFVVEGNGDVYPCDFYCTDAWKLGTVAEPFEKLLHTEKADLFIQSSLPVSDACKSCRHYPLCHGGCRRWRDTKKAAPLSLNSLCPSYQMFFDHAGERILKLGQIILDCYGNYRY